MFRWARLAKAQERAEPLPEAPSVEQPAVEEDLEAEITAALRTVNDPEIPVNIYDLGLIYEVDVSPGGQVYIQMTLTAPACPVAGMMPGMVEGAVRRVPGVSDVRVELVWDPPWTQDRMTEEAQLQLGLL